MLFVLIAFISTSCANETKHTKHEGLSNKLFTLKGQGWKSKQIIHFTNNLSYKATQVPSEYYLLKNEGTSDLKQIDSISKRLENERIIEFEFEHFESDDLLKSNYTNLNYDESVMYMANTIQKDFIAITAKNDTIPCVGVLFERNFKVAPFKRVLLYFNNIPPEENIQLIYNDALFNNGTFKFKFSEIPFKT